MIYDLRGCDACFFVVLVGFLVTWHSCVSHCLLYASCVVPTRWYFESDGVKPDLSALDLVRHAESKKATTFRPPGPFSQIWWLKQGVARNGKKNKGAKTRQTIRGGGLHRYIRQEKKRQTGKRWKKHRNVRLLRRYQFGLEFGTSR